MTNEKKILEIAGYSIFNDEEYKEHKELQQRNRAVTMCNIFEAAQRDKQMAPKLSAILVNYFNAIPAEERKDLYEEYIRQMKERGYVPV